MDSARVVIRPFETPEDHRQCETVQRQVWVGDDVVPTNMTITIQRHGGLALGAFDGDGALLGFVLSMLSPAHQPGARNGLCHHSHVAAVLPTIQGKRIGEALKRAQAEEIQRRGFNLMTWTYDPLEARNAWLNIHKLGCICRTFIRNCYGDMRDAMNRGLPSDRFEAEWWLDKAPLSSCETVMADGQLLLDTRADALYIDIPTDFQALKRSDLAAAQQVRLETRAQFESAFGLGYIVSDFTTQPNRAYYTLTKLG
jgi:predicted GNAT superfamily acetyltransferase